MAQEKPSTLLAAQVWVADQRSRWNDLASLHLADIDLMLDKQLKWVNDHSEIEYVIHFANDNTYKPYGSLTMLFYLHLLTVRC
jgi:hypothetical protein